MSDVSAAAENSERVTHGRHCTCSACAREDWTRIKAPCGMHGSDCPAVYAPLGAAGTTISHDPTQRAEATTTPEGAKGWVDQAGSAQVLAGGHGLNVAPDASPDSIRAKARREQDGGGKPSSTPTAALAGSSPNSTEGATDE